MCIRDRYKVFCIHFGVRDMIYRISRNVPEFYTIVSVGVDVCTWIYIPMRENGCFYKYLAIYNITNNSHSEHE